LEDCRLSVETAVEQARASVVEHVTEVMAVASEDWERCGLELNRAAFVEAYGERVATLTMELA
jgi:hypothetical protein